MVILVGAFEHIGRRLIFRDADAEKHVESERLAQPRRHALLHEQAFELSRSDLSAE